MHATICHLIVLAALGGPAGNAPADLESEITHALQQAADADFVGVISFDVRRHGYDAAGKSRWHPRQSWTITTGRNGHLRTEHTVEHSDSPPWIVARANDTRWMLQGGRIVVRHGPATGEHHDMQSVFMVMDNLLDNAAYYSSFVRGRPNARGELRIIDADPERPVAMVSYAGRETRYTFARVDGALQLASREYSDGQHDHRWTYAEYTHAGHMCHPTAITYLSIPRDKAAPLAEYTNIKLCPATDDDPLAADTFSVPTPDSNLARDVAFYDFYFADGRNTRVADPANQVDRLNELLGLLNPAITTASAGTP